MEFSSSAIGVLETLVTTLGAGLAAWGAINLMEGYGNDNPGSKSQGIKQLMAGGGDCLNWYDSHSTVEWPVLMAHDSQEKRCKTCSMELSTVGKRG